MGVAIILQAGGDRDALVDKDGCPDVDKFVLRPICPCSIRSYKLQLRVVKSSRPPVQV